MAPPLPAGFNRKFNRSAEVLHKVYVDGLDADPMEDTICKQS